MSSRVKVFKASINEVEYVVNEWAEQAGARIISVSITYDQNAMLTGSVFVLIAYEAADTPNIGDR